MTFGDPSHDYSFPDSRNTDVLRAFSPRDFGGIDASPVTSGFTAWLNANANDTAWANTIAAAFEDAGSGSGITTVSDAALDASLAAAGVGASRQDLVIDPPTAWGGAPTTGFVNDPVNSATGNFLEPENNLPGASSKKPEPPELVCMPTTRPGSCRRLPLRMGR